MGVGQLESEIACSPAQAVIDNEILAYVRRMRRGVAVDEGTLAVDVIRETGIGGEFLSHPHTLERWRDEIVRPGLFERATREKWEAEGARSVEERAEEVAERLVGADGPPSLDADRASALRSIELRFLSHMG